MNYDTATAHEILVMAVTSAYDEDYLPVIESALRSAVIREEKVKTTVWLHVRNGAARFQDIVGGNGLPDGDYDFIPRKETP